VISMLRESCVFFVGVELHTVALKNGLFGRKSRDVVFAREFSGANLLAST